MAAATANPEIFTGAPAAPPARPRLLLTGTFLVIGCVLMLFAGLLGVYLAARHNVIHPASGKAGSWLPKAAELVAGKPVDAKIPLTPGNMILFTLALSGITMQWAVYSVGNNDRQGATLAMVITIMFGIAAISATSFLYTQMHLPVSTAQGVLIYTITGAHLAMVVVGLVFASVMTFRTLGGEYAGRDREGITAAAIFWYATIAVYAAIWLAIYITK